FAHSDADLSDETKRFALSPTDIALLNPNTKTCPIFRSAQDAELTKSIYRRVPILVNESKGEAGNAWGISFRQGLFNMTSDSGLFRSAEELEARGLKLEGNVWRDEENESAAFLPLYEAKMLHHFDHRWATYDEAGDTRDVTLAEKQNADFVVTPRYWVEKSNVEERLKDKSDKEWLLGFRDICRNNDERTVIASILPSVGVGNNAPLMFFDKEPRQVACLVANLSSFALDWVARFKVGGVHLNFFIAQQLPVLPPSTYASSAAWTDGATLGEWISSRVVELCFTAHDLTAFARDCGFDGEPFGWDAERRFEVRCELDAAFFALYGLSMDEAAYVLDTFPIVKRKDEAKFGSYRTKTRILELMAAMQSSSAAKNV
ncbi:MAG: SAM-dependent DNA methyltransferase, partial [Armatimonadetes bacterium]|nr:SAM-dependent DNA methyltransferase [Armatimonadota bacterium]